jgi:sugar phosphate isomerase/epimerase
MPADRRTFLQLSALQACLFALPAAASNTPPKPWKMGLGLNGFMSSESEYGKKYPLWEVLDFAADYGFDGIELVEGWPQGGYPSPAESARVDALRRLYDQYGLSVYTIQTGGLAHAADPGARTAWLNHFRDYARLATALGCEFIGHWPGGDLAGNEDVAGAIRNLAQSYREAATIAQDHGLWLSFEIEPPFIFNTLDHLRAILDATDHPACKTNYDPSHFDLMSGSRGTPEAMLRALGVEHIGHVHLTDTDGTQYGGTSRHLACGEGHCDIPASLKTLWDGGYRGWIMVDAWKIEDPYNAAREGKDAVTAFLAHQVQDGRHPVPTSL